MSRLHTKCVFASAGAHLLLLAVLVVSSAFVNPPAKTDTTKYIKLFDASKITDDETQGGGNPNVPSDVVPIAPTVKQEPPIQLPPPVDKPKPQVKKETPKPPKPVVKKEEPRKAEPLKVEVPKADPKKTEPRKIEVNLNVVKKATSDPDAQKKKQERERAIKEAKEREEAERREYARAQAELVDRANREYKERQAALSGIVGKIENKMSSGTIVEMPAGPGGAAFVNYADFLWNRYYQAWQTPDREIRTPVKVEIVVARDGRVISANIVQRSGDAAVDRSVRQALDRVSKLPPFPEGTTDVQRTFKVNFLLIAKRQLG